MANIYEKQAVSDFANKSYSSEGNVGQWLMKEGEKLEGQGEKTEDKAKQTYSNALNVDWQNSMNSLINNPKYSADPKALQEESRKLTEKMSKEIVDDDVKVDFLVNAQLKSNAYYKNALANRKRIDDENRKMYALNSAYSDIDFVGKTISNGIAGTADVDDLFSAQQTLNNFEKNISIRNPDGTFVFSPETQIALREKIKKNKVDSFVDRFSVLPEYEQKKVYEELEKGNVFLGFVSTPNGERGITLKDVFSEDEIASVRSDAKKQMLANRRAKLNEIKLQQEEAYYDFISNPTPSGLERYKKLNPRASKETIQDMEDILSADPNFEATTTFSDDVEAYNELKRIVSLPSDTDEQRNDKLAEGIKYSKKLVRSNTDGNLTYEKKKEYTEDLINSLSDDSLKKRIESLPGLTALQKINRFFDTWGENSGPIDATWGALRARNKVDEITHSLTSTLLSMANQGASAEDMQQVYDSMMEEAVKARYWYIDDIQNKRLVKGETIIDLGHGVPYVFNGFVDGDILIERK